MNKYKLTILGQLDQNAERQIRLYMFECKIYEYKFHYTGKKHLMFACDGTSWGELMDFEFYATEAQRNRLERKIRNAIEHNQPIIRYYYEQYITKA